MFGFRRRGAAGGRSSGRGWIRTALAVAVLVVMAAPLSPRSNGASQAAPQERPDLRTAVSATVENADGSFTTSLYAEPIHYRDDAGSWQRIDSTLVPSAKAGYAWTNRANAFHVDFKNQLGSEFLRFAVGDRAFTLDLVGARQQRSKVAGRSVRYANVMDGVALDYAVEAGGVEETLTLADASVPTTYRFRLDPHGAALSPRQLPGGVWAFMAPGHSGPLFVLQAPLAFDAAGKDGSRHAAVDVQRVGSRFDLVLSIDRDWLSDPARAFPVRLDPTVTVQPSSTTGNFDISCGTCTDMSTPLWTGVDDTDVWRTLVKFNLGSIPAGAQVTAATFGLWNDSTSCVYVSTGECGDQSHTLTAHRVTKAWNTTTTTSAQLGFDPAVLSTFALPSHAPDGWMTWDVASTVQSWVSATQLNYGILVKRSTEPAGVGGPAPPGNDGYDPTQAPRLTVTYKGDGVVLDPPGTLHGNGADLRWSQWDGSTGNAFGGYEIHRSQTATFTPSATTLVATFKDPAITSYRDTTAAPSKAFTYKVVVNGVSSQARTVTLPADGQASTSMTLSPPASQQTYLEDVAGTDNCSNYGGSEMLYIGTDDDGYGTTWKYRPLVSFDVRTIPVGSKVTSAKLQLYADYMPPATTVTVEAHRATAAWKEGTGGLWTSPDYCTGDGATWLETQGGVKWNTPGGDFDSVVGASVQHTANDSAKWDTFELASTVQKWVDGTAPNLGVLFKFSNETPRSVNWFAYDSQYDTWDTSLRPKLSLVYADGSRALPPAVAVGAPAPGGNVSGTVTVTTGASDDGRVAKVELYVDNALASTVTSAPWQFAWNTTTLAAGNHTLKAVATDDAGLQTTSSLVTVNVDNSAAPATSVTSPAAGATVSGTATVSASATDDRSVSHVEFYVDGNRFTDTAVAPYSAPLDTANAADPVFDGSHTLTTKAYDAGGHVTTSSSVVITVKNAPAGSQYAATYASTETPQGVTYDPAAATQDSAGIDVTVTNTSGLAWSAGSVVLRYRWVSSDATPVYGDGPDVPLAATVAAGASATLRVLVPAPALPDGVERSRYTLRFDLFDKASGSWFSGKGVQPLDNPVIVNKALVREALGLESYYTYVSRDVGAGMQQATNVANGNSILRWQPFSEPGRGLPTVLDLTYNALEKKCDCPAGNNWSLAISTLSRFGNPIDIHPNKADQIGGRSNKFIEFTDGDGTTHRFTDSNSDGYWEAPAGQHLYLRQYSTSETTKYWALTRPDRITFYYDQSGYPTSVVDANGNTLAFTESAVAPADDPGGPRFKITKVTDAGGRSFDIAYFTKADAKKPQIRGKVKSITDHAGRTLLFDYYFDGNLLRITQKGGTNADGSFLADRSFVFTYTTSDGSGPAIPLASDRVNPDAKTSNESTRLYSVRDPRGNETRFAYIGPGNGTDRWKIASLTDRAGAQTVFAYDTVNRVTTITEPLNRVSRYTYDTEGKVTEYTNPLDQKTTYAWNGDRQQTKVTEPTGAYSETAYNDNGLITDTWDQLRNRTQYEYENIAVDGNDVVAKWEAGRTIPHISQVKTVTAPKGTATATPTTDYQTAYAYDAKGNVTSVTNPLGFVTRSAYNADGTVASTTDPNNHVTTYVSYDANGLATEIRDANGQSRRFGYGDDGLLLWKQDALHAADTGSNPREYRTYFDYDSFGRVGASSKPKSTTYARGVLIWTATTFDPNSNVTSEAAAAYAPGGGAKTTYEYDAMDRRTAVVGPDRSAGQERTEFAYDAAGRLTRITLPLGVASTAIANDYVTETSYDAADQATKETQYPKEGNAAEARVTNFCYDLAGDLRSTTAPRGVRADAPTPFTSCPPATAPSTYVYTPASYTTKYAYEADHELKSTTDALGNTSSETRDANGNVDSETDGEGNVVAYGYNIRDDVVQEERPFDPARPTRKLTTKYEYDAAGNLLREISPRSVDSQGAGPYTNYVTTYGYDAVDQLAAIKHPVDGSTRQAWTNYAYNANGEVTSASLPVDTDNPVPVGATQQTRATYYDTGLIRTIDYPDKGVITFDYTAEGWQMSRTPAGGPAETWNYYADGELKENTDPNGHPNTFTYDLDNNLVRTDDATGVDVPTEAPLVVEQDYNGFDEPTQTRQRKEPPGQTPPAWRVTDYVYDANGNREQRTDEGRTQTLGYDQADRFTSQFDANAVGCADDRQLTVSYLRNGWKAAEIVRAGDGGCDPTTWPIKRQTAWMYFSNGRLQTLQSWKGAQSAANSVESRTLEYESNGVYLNGSRTKDSFTLQGPGTAPCRTPACVAVLTYDARERLTQWANGLPGSDASTTTYTLDPDTAGVDTLDGNVVKEVVTGAGARTRDYTYSPAGQVQVLAVNGTPSQRYFWDKKSGNIGCVTDAGYTDDTCSVQAGLRDWYAFDALDRLKVFKSYRANATVDSSYVYDAFDRVTTETEAHNGGAAATTDFAYLATSSQISTATPRGGAAGTRYTYDGNDQRLGRTLMSSQPQEFSFARNPHGDVSLLVDDAGSVTASYAYKPYGDLDATVARGDLDKTKPDNPFRFDDKRFDSGSRSIDMGARHYDPDDGRFVQQDFARDAAADLGLSTDAVNYNRYAFAAGNPVRFKEKDGHMVRPDEGGAPCTSFRRMMRGYPLGRTSYWVGSPHGGTHDEYTAGPSGGLLHQWHDDDAYDLRVRYGTTVCAPITGYVRKSPSTRGALYVYTGSFASCLDARPTHPPGPHVTNFRAMCFFLGHLSKVERRSGRIYRGEEVALSGIGDTVPHLHIALKHRRWTEADPVPLLTTIVRCKQPIHLLTPCGG